MLGRRIEDEARRAIGLVDGVGLLEAVGQPGRVREQVPDEHRLRRAGGDGRRRHPVAVDVQVPEGRDELGHRVEERERALLVEQHGRDRGDRLGHRVDAPDRVGLDGQAGLRVALPAVRHVGDPPAARDGQQRALVASVGHEAVEVGVQPREAPGIEPDLLRCDLRRQRRRRRHPSLLVRRSDQTARAYGMRVASGTDDGRRPRVAHARRVGAAAAGGSRPAAGSAAPGREDRHGRAHRRRLGRRLRRHRDEPALRAADALRVRPPRRAPDAGHGVRRHLARHLDDHDHRLGQVRDLHHARRQRRRGRDHGPHRPRAGGRASNAAGPSGHSSHSGSSARRCSMATG